MTTLKEAAGHAQNWLFEVMKHDEEILTLPERKAGYATLVAVLEKQLDAERAALRARREQLARVQAELAPKQRQVDALRAQADEQIAELMARAEAEWSAIAAKIAEAHAEIIAIEASTQSLRQRLDIAVAA